MPHEVVVGSRTHTSRTSVSGRSFCCLASSRSESGVNTDGSSNRFALKSGDSRWSDESVIGTHPRDIGQTETIPDYAIPSDRTESIGTFRDRPLEGSDRDVGAFREIGMVSPNIRESVMTRNSDDTNPSASDELQTAELPVPKMNCPWNARRIADSLQGVDGIVEAAVKPRSNAVVVTYDPARRSEAAITAIAERRTPGPSQDVPSSRSRRKSGGCQCRCRGRSM